MELFREIRGALTGGGMAAGEARAVAMLLLEEVCGLTSADVLMGRADELAVCEPGLAVRLMEAARRVAAGEPVQYVLGRARFCGLTLRVAPGVLIPRPETEELVDASACFVASRYGGSGKGNPRILDLCTGSGCIAVALAKRLPCCMVAAVDVSDEALAIARENALASGVQVRFERRDILAEGIEDILPEGMEGTLMDGTGGVWDVIVSNPPYICCSEAAGMERNVLDHEPHLALFVPDDDPLLFYRRIAHMALRRLASGGLLAFEINRRFGRDIVAMLRSLGFIDVAVAQDRFGNDRVVTAIKA